MKLLAWEKKLNKKRKEQLYQLYEAVCRSYLLSREGSDTYIYKPIHHVFHRHKTACPAAKAGLSAT